MKRHYVKQVVLVKLMLIMILSSITLIPGLGQTAKAAVQSSYYVDPVNGSDLNNGTSSSSAFKTIEKARDIVSTVNSNMTGDIIVYLRGGRYELTQTITFDGNDSGTNGYRVIYRNYHDESPILDGGKIISNWTSIGNGIYSASVPSGMTFRQLYIGGSYATRARTPNAGTYGNPQQSEYYQIAAVENGNKRLKINKNEISNWNNLNQVEMVILRSYTQTRLRINHFTTDTNFAYVVPQEYDRTDAFSFGAPFNSSSYFFENAYEFLDSPGEWYLDTTQSKVYYMPKIGEDMSTIQVIAPNLERMLEIDGSSSITFFGLTLKHSTWLGPNTTGFVQRQGGLRFHDNATYPQLYSIGGLKVSYVQPAAVYLKNSNNIQFERNIFRHLGANAINYDIGTHDNYVIGNVFDEIADSGMVIGMSQEPMPNPGEGNWNETVSNNYFHRLGMDYTGSMAMFAGHVNGLHFEHNEVDGSGNLAVNSGWGNINSEEASRRNIKFRYNKISNVAFSYRDSGGIHVKDNTPGGEVFENYFKDIQYAQVNVGTNSSPVGAVYLDNDASNYTVEHNVMDNDVTVSRITTWEKTGTPNYDLNNASNDQTVKDNAGLESAYANIKNYLNGGSIGGSMMPVKPLKYWDPTPPFIEDFEDGVADGWYVTGGEWSVVTDGATEVYKNSATSGGAFIGDYTLNDYSVEMKIKPLSYSGSNTQVIGFSARYNYSTNERYNFVYYKDLNKLRIRKYVGSSWTILAEKTYTMNTGSWNTWRADLNGTNIDLYINGALELTTTDSSLSLGRASIHTYNATAEFDDVKISYLDSFKNEISGTDPNNWIEESGNWQVSTDSGNQVYWQSGIGNSGARTTYVMNESKVEFQGNFKLNNFATNAAVWYAVRWTDDNNHVQAGYDKSSGKWVIRQKVNGSLTTLKSVPESINTMQWYKVRVVASGSNISLYVNDTLKLAATNSTYTSAGRVALYSHMADTYFDNIRIGID